MKICVISDMHCKFLQNLEEGSDTLLTSNKPRRPVNQHPVAAFLNLIRKEKLKADILLCPGDLADKADEQGIISSWAFLEEIMRELNADSLFGVPGNHDINSRKNYGKEPFAFIKSFHENFPVSDENMKIKFWESKYCLMVFKSSLFLLLNTVHDHTDGEKAKGSSILPETLESIRAELQHLKMSDFKHKVCVMHHHPVKHSNIQNWKDTDSVDRGDELMSILSQYGFNIVIHGHKHQPRLIEHSSVPILAAGSFASYANLQGTGIQTMFHIIELQEGSRKGVINSWEYDIVNGWTQKDNKAFPPRIGFGALLNISGTAQKINEIYECQGKIPLFYDAIVKVIPDIQYLIPDKLIELGNILKEQYSLKPTPEYPLDPVKISEYIKIGS